MLKLCHEISHCPPVTGAVVVCSSECETTLPHKPLGVRIFRVRDRVRVRVRPLAAGLRGNRLSWLAFHPEGGQVLVVVRGCNPDCDPTVLLLTLTLRLVATLMRVGRVGVR